LVRDAGRAASAATLRRFGGGAALPYGEIGGVSDTQIVGALLGQMKLAKPLAAKAAKLFGLSEVEERMLNEMLRCGTPMPPTMVAVVNAKRRWRRSNGGTSPLAQAGGVGAVNLRS
jgi:hypothetical protein